MESNVKIVAEMPHDQALELAVFLRRLHFCDYLSHTDDGQSDEERRAQAYRFRDAEMVLEEALADAMGFRAR